jgi:hypothetical protein
MLIALHCETVMLSAFAVVLVA